MVGRAAPSATLIAAFIAGMWWWGFDFGQLFGGVNRREIEARMASLEADTAALRTEATTLRARNSQLESEARDGARRRRRRSRKQAADLAAENAQLKEETAFLQQLLGRYEQAARHVDPAAAVERQGDDTWRYSLLIVRGGNPRDEFAGRARAAGNAPDARTPVTARRRT